MDWDVNIFEEKDTFECKCNHKITHPEMCIIFVETGVSQKGDGHISGKIILCECGTKTKNKTSSEDKHFTLCGLLLLNRTPLVCILFMTTVNPKIYVDTVIGFFAENKGYICDNGF